jgi:hypothetical protein
VRPRRRRDYERDLSQVGVAICHGSGTFGLVGRGGGGHDCFSL